MADTNMKMLEVKSLSNGATITRVPGGYIYSLDVHTIFLNNEKENA